MTPEATGVSVSGDITRSALKTLYALTKMKVLIGIPAENAGRDDDSPLNNAELGYIMEFGAPAANIPARPHLVPGVEAYLPRAQERLKAAAMMAIERRDKEPEQPAEIRNARPSPSRMEIQNLAAAAATLVMPDPVLAQMEACGLEAVSSVRSVITAGVPPPLKPGTIAARKRMGHEGETPLIETGDYLRHISYVVRKG